MSPDMSDPHVRSQRTIIYDNEPKQKKSDSLWMSRNVHDWYVGFDVDESGKVSMSVSKTLGRLGKSDNREAKVTFKVETTDHRLPALKVMESAYGREPRFVEIDDRKNRTTESFKEEEKYYRREYPSSSVILSDELLNETATDLIDLLKDKQFNEYITKISNDAAKVQQPYNKNYILEK